MKSKEEILRNSPRLCVHLHYCAVHCGEVRFPCGKDRIPVGRIGGRTEQWQRFQGDNVCRIKIYFSGIMVIIIKRCATEGKIMVPKTFSTVKKRIFILSLFQTILQYIFFYSRTFKYIRQRHRL